MRPTPMDESTWLLYAQRLQGNHSAGPASNWAIQQLREGRETHFVLIVAGLGPDASSWEVDRYLACAMEELGWDPPTQEQTLRWLAAHSAEHILARTDASPAELYELVRDIARVCQQLQYPDELLGMYALEE